MPPSTGKSGLFAKVAGQAKAVHSATAAKPVVMGNAGLPNGIENGVAQLVDAHFGEYKDGANKGKLFFMAAGIVKEPKEHAGIAIEGLRTQIGPLPLCDTPQAQGKKKTFQDHYDNFLNELKKFEACPANVDAVETTVAQLVKVAPHFRFRTWQGKPTALFPNPRVNQEWLGLCQYNGSAADPAAHVDEDPGAEPAPAEEPAADAAPTGDIDADGALMALAEQADAGDEAANLQLQDIAAKHGLTEDDLADTEKYPDWKTVIASITGAGGEETTEETAEETEEVVEEPTPEKGGKCKYKPLDPKDAKKKKRLAAVTCEITAVDADKKTLSLKYGKSIVKGVKWDAVELV